MSFASRFLLTLAALSLAATLVSAQHLPSDQSRAGDCEYRLPLTHAGYLQLKPYFQQGALARTDLYLACSDCLLETKIRLMEKSKKKICLQVSTRTSEEVLSCANIPLTVRHFKQEEACGSRGTVLERGLSLGHSLLSPPQQLAGVANSQEEFVRLLRENFASLLKGVDLKKARALVPAYRNTKLRWYLQEADDPLAAKVKIFLGITFYQDKLGREQNRYELEARARLPLKAEAMALHLCGFIERMKLRKSDIELLPFTEGTFHKTR